MTDVTMRQLLEYGVHFGHQTRFWCPKMSPYIYGHRNKIHIINLERTLTMFNEALDYLSGVAAKRGSVVFVGTKRQAGKIIREQAQRAESPYVYHRWLGGMLTNNRTVRKSIDRLNELNDIIASDGINKIAKKEAMRIERERFRLDRNLAGIMDMRGLPDALFVIDVKHENIAIKEANKLGIPVVAVVDTNCDPDGIDYVIPGNDDAVSAIRLYCTAAADAIIAGKAKAKTEIPQDGAAGPGGLVSAEDYSHYPITNARAAVAPSVRVDPSESAEPETETQVASVPEVTEQVPSVEPESKSAEPAPVATDTEGESEEAPPVAADVEGESEEAPPVAADVEGESEESEPVAAETESEAEEKTSAESETASAEPAESDESADEPEPATDESESKESKE